jgi:hypothetical protein
MSQMLKRMFAECQTPSFSKRFDLDPLVNRPVRNLAVALQAADPGLR